MKHTMDVLSQIKGKRLESGLTQGDVARLLDIDQGTYSKIESGQITLSLDRLFEIALVLRASIKIDIC